MWHFVERGGGPNWPKKALRNSWTAPLLYCTPSAFVFEMSRLMYWLIQASDQQATGHKNVNNIDWPPVVRRYSTKYKWKLTTCLCWTVTSIQNGQRKHNLILQIWLVRWHKTIPNCCVMQCRLITAPAVMPEFPNYNNFSPMLLQQKTQQYNADMSKH